MKKIIFFFCFFLITFASVSANTYIENTINGKKVKIFEYDLQNKDFIFKVSVNPDYNATSLKDLMERNNGVSAINGVFFCPKDYRECGGKDFTRNERYVEGLKYSGNTETGDRVVFAWDKENNPFLFQSGKINPNDESKIYYGLANHPLILQNSESKIEEYEKLGLVDSKMKSRGTRNFICSNQSKTKIYTGLVYNINLYDLAIFLKDFGCSDALNLDAGATTSMIYNGSQIAGPGRNLLDGIIIERKGLDTAKIRELTQVVIENFLKRVENQTFDEQINYFTDLNKKLNLIKNKIYDINSISLFDEELKKTGYRIEIKDLKSLENIYLINNLTILINNKISELKKEKKKAENNFDLMF